MRISGAALLLLSMAVALPSCGGGNSKAPNTCTPGNTQACTGPGACAGGQSCLADGTAWSTCDCGGGTGRGGTTGSAGAPAGTGGSTAGSAGTVGNAGTVGSGGVGQGGGAGTGSTCPANRRLCGTECVDTAGDPRHCGGCGQACGTNQVCAPSGCQAAGDCRQTPCVGLTYCDLANGQCKPGCASDTQCGANEMCDLVAHTCACKSGFYSCAGSCVPANIPTQCGPSCTMCVAPANATATCANGACGFTCNAGYIACGGRCYAGTTSVAACGASCTSCSRANATATCTGGVCQYTCNAGFVACGDTCIQETGRNCTTGAQCCTARAEVCSGGRCAGPYTRCSANSDCPTGRICPNDVLYCVLPCVGMGTPCSMPPGGTAACYDGDQGLTCTYLCDTAPCPGGIPCTFSTYCSYVP